MEQGVKNSWHWVKCPILLPALKDWLQPNTIAISEATYRLVQGYFACEDLGAQTLRGVAEPVHGVPRPPGQVEPGGVLMWR